jgi:hypothetical protein
MRIDDMGLECSPEKRVDVVTLALLAQRINEDLDKGWEGISAPFARSIARIIQDAIGAPLMTPVSQDGAAAADEMFPGNPSARHGFNAGVAWAVQQMPGRVKLRGVSYPDD